MGSRSPEGRPRRRRTPAGAAAAVRAAGLAVALACGAPAPEFRGAPVDPPLPAPELEGTNWDGEAFRLSELDGRVRVVFFGYTSCPDVCPFTLARLRELEERLGAERAERVEVVFVSVDPDRDTQKRLAGYVPGFDRGFYGLRLEGAELDDALADYRIEVARQRSPREAILGFYTVDHTGTLFVIDPAGRLRVTFPHDVEVDDLLADIDVLLREAETRPGRD